jgi:hypothetical protein
VRVEPDRDSPASPPGPTPSRSRRVYSSAYTRGTKVYDRGRLWIENQDPSSRKGATIGWVRRYRAADGQLYAVLLTACSFVLQTKALRGDPSWIGWGLDVGWLAVLVGFFVWAPRLLIHRRVAARDSERTRDRDRTLGAVAAPSVLTEAAW